MNSSVRLCAFSFLDALYFLVASTSGQGPTPPITFSEFSVGSRISNQYADRGIVFGGDSPTIVRDSANPTSPVLAGSPRFFGAIEGRFVDPGDGVTPVVVQSVTMDAGYFDALGSTRLSWFDPDGNRLGQVINASIGIQPFRIEGGNIAGFRFEIVATKPAGYAIDNVSYTPSGSSVLFREKTGDRKDGTWGFLDDEIPGFDHTAFQLGDLVYESHPGYEFAPGNYVSADGSESVFIDDIDGVQAQHTSATFEHDSPSTGDSPVVSFEEIPVDEALAMAMQQAIVGGPLGRDGFQRIDFSSLDGIRRTLSPSAQKGGGGSFTCVGLVEWAAEQAGHRGGDGFIPDRFEEFLYIDFTVFPPVTRTLPLLSPQLLNYAMKAGNLVSGARQFLQGMFDPVDFVITDPLGRRMGYTAALGTLDEIPFAFFSGDGNVEQFLIPFAVPGRYRIEFFGLDESVAGAIEVGDRSIGLQQFLGAGVSLRRDIFVHPDVGVPGDVDRDGDVDDSDRDDLVSLLGSFADGAGDPADLDGDGFIDNSDLALIDNVLSNLAGGCGCAPAANLYGTGFGGRAGVPGIELLGVPALGTRVFVQLDNDTRGATAGVLLIGSQSGSTILPNSAELLVSLDPEPVAQPFFLTGLRGGQYLQLPTDPAVCGEVYLQAAILDRSAPGGFALTRGLRIEIGD